MAHHTVIAILVAALPSMLIAIFFPLFFLGKRSKAEQEKAHARRMTDAKMNARLLRFNL